MISQIYSQRKSVKSEIRSRYQVTMEVQISLVLKMVMVTYRISSVWRQLVLVKLEDVVNVGVPAVEHGVSHGGR